MGGYETFVSASGGTPQRYYTLNYDQMMLVGITVKRQKNLEVQFCTSKKIDSAFKQLGDRAAFANGYTGD
ncbi:hypothetical protein [Salmonella enterica]|uniref:hypothetical protein n=1 Tax=Salmonella enterica TaxID=28901 RepID=UPI001124EF82|nr:hypothetical protein [Salmonella enterica]